MTDRIKDMIETREQRVLRRAWTGDRVRGIDPHIRFNVGEQIGSLIMSLFMVGVISMGILIFLVSVSDLTSMLQHAMQ